MQYSGNCLLYPAVTPNVAASCNWGLPHHEAWGGACVSWTNVLRTMTLTWFTPYTCMSIARIETKPTLITEDNRAPFHSPIDSLWHHSSRACRDVSDSLTRGIRDQSPAACRRFPMVFGDIAGAIFAPNSFRDAFYGGHRCLHNTSILACVCTTRPSRTWSTGVGMFHTSLLEEATHHWYILPNIMCSNTSIWPFRFLQAYNTTPFKWLKCSTGICTRQLSMVVL